MADRLTAAMAGGFARIALGHVTREYPSKLDHVLNGPQDLRSPRALHPVFFGSFDWHSCVHGHWLLAALYRRFPDLDEAPRIAAHFAARLTADNIAGELAYLGETNRAGFERPYGWAWLLKLAAELTAHESAAGRRWLAALTPLAAAFARRFTEFLGKATYPVRAGTHGNTAFALIFALDYAEAEGDEALAEAAREAARRWYGGDADCQAWEPSGDEFLSPSLIEACCMRRALPEAEFAAWLGGFLPRLSEQAPAALFTPAVVSDRGDGKIVHLEGLNLSRAWCWRTLAAAVGATDPRRAVMLDAAERHLAASLPHVSGDYMGEHWLASFAVLALAPP